jgi:hypothetical protein
MDSPSYPQYRVKVIRDPQECTDLEFNTFADALTCFFSIRRPDFAGQLQLWDRSQLISSWRGLAQVVSPLS